MRSLSLVIFLLHLSRAFYCAAGQPLPSVQTYPLEQNWIFRKASDTTWYPAEVPGCVHTDLLRNGLIPDPFFGTNEQELQWIGETDWIYQSTFDLPAGFLQRDSVELVFQGLDTYASVLLNDSILLSANNMFREWRKECKSRLKLQGNRLAVRFRNVFDENLPKYRSAPFPLQAFSNNDQGDVKIAMYSRKAQFHYGWDWGPRLITCGIWRPAFIEAWNALKIRSMRVQADNVSEAGADIKSLIEICSSMTQHARVLVALDSLTLGAVEQELAPGVNRIMVTGRIEKPRLWWTNGLGDQPLYRLRASVVSSQGFADERAINIGIRSLEIVREKDSMGISLFVRLNGVPVFMKGANYIPQDNFQSRVNPRRYERMIRSAAQANMNMLRVWGGGVYEDDLFYDFCDRYGILVWQDLMFACAMYPADEEFLQNVQQEVVENVSRMRHHPCIALYCGNNENDISWYAWGWKQLYPPETQAVYERNLHRLFGEVIPGAVHEADPTRYYHPTSPNTGFNSVSASDGDLHYWGVWHGKQPFESYQQHIGRFVSEFGFQSYPELSTVEKFTDPQDRQLHSAAMLSHQRCMSDERRDKEYGNRLIKTYMDAWFREPKDFESYLYVSQVLQAEGVKTGIEAHRRAMPTCMGSLYWQLDDCWPVASWSSIDYYGKWKALHYTAQKSFAPIVISPVIGEEEVHVYVVSDRLDTVSAVLEIAVIEFSGKRVFRQAAPLRVEPNASRLAATLSRKEMGDGGNEASLAIVSRITASNGVLAEDVSYFVTPKVLDLEHPVIAVRSTRTAAGYEVELVSNTLAKSVYLSCRDGEGTFSDNFFDLLPSVVKKVEFTITKEVENFKNQLKIISLTDSY